MRRHSPVPPGPDLRPTCYATSNGVLCAAYTLLTPSKLHRTADVDLVTCPDCIRKLSMRVAKRMGVVTCYGCGGSGVAPVLWKPPCKVCGGTGVRPA